MNKQDNEQFSIPDNKPDHNNPDPQQPSQKEKEEIRKGAETEDQLEKLKPDNEADKAPNELGSPPDTKVDNGEKDN